MAEAARLAAEELAEEPDPALRQLHADLKAVEASLTDRLELPDPEDPRTVD